MFQENWGMLSHPSGNMRSLKIKWFILPKWFTDSKATHLMRVQHVFIFFASQKSHLFGQVHQSAVRWTASVKLWTRSPSNTTEPTPKSFWQSATQQTFGPERIHSSSLLFGGESRAVVLTVCLGTYLSGFSMTKCCVDQKPALSLHDNWSQR